MSAQAIDQPSLLDLLSHDPRKESDYRAFLAACRDVRLGQREYVSINDVRARLSNRWGLNAHPQTYSSWWSRAQRDGLLERTDVIEKNDGKHSKRNRGKPCYLYRWVGGAS